MSMMEEKEPITLKESSGVHSTDDSSDSRRQGVSFLSYFIAEITRGYQLKDNEKLYSEKQRQVTTFMKTPRELEKLMLFGFFICLDAFLFIFTILPLRLLLAVLSFLWCTITCSRQRLDRAYLIDIIRASIFASCMFAMSYIDTSALYHIIRAQSVIKLYVIFNMLEIFDRLLASIGQDTLDTLYWLVVDYNRERSRDHFKTIFYFFLAVLYVFIHTNVILVQATTLSVAVNSYSKALLTIMISNNFVELKGSVFKKFEINNLFQMSCSDIRERFHYVILMFVIVIRNFSQSGDLTHLESIIPIVLSVILSEVFVDCIKHAFITKFNDISPDIYRRYRYTLSKDMTVSRSTKATSEHSDLVARRMGFIPLPLSCLLCKTISQSVSLPRDIWMKLLVIIYISLIMVKIFLGVMLLRTAWRYHDNMEKKKQELDSLDDQSVFTKTDSSSHLRKRRSSTESKSSDLLLGAKLDLEDRTSSSKLKSRSLSDIERFTLCSNRIV